MPLLRDEHALLELEPLGLQLPDASLHPDHLLQNRLDILLGHGSAGPGRPFEKGMAVASWQLFRHDVDGMPMVPSCKHLE